MRKTAKILSVLLTLCLLCGVMVSVVASATGSDYYTSLEVTTHDNNVSWDFEEGNAPTWNMGTGKTGSVNSLNDNGYYNVTISTDPDNTSTASSSTSQLSIGKTIDGVSYITLDFEFGTDKYLYDSDEDGKFDTYSDEEPVGYDWIPAYGYNAGSTNNATNSTDNSNNRRFMIGYTRFTDGGKDLGLRANNYVNFAEVYVGYDVDIKEYYLFVKGADNVVNTRYPIANEVGVYEHITKVYKIEASTTENYDYTITEYIYINGQYIGKVSNDLADYTVDDGAEEGKEAYTSIYSSVFNTWTDGYAANNKYYYSYAFDNLAVNFYSSDYNTDPAEGEADTVYGLDDFVKAGANDFICYCDDVLYNEKYKTPNPERYIEIGGYKYYIINFAKHLSNLKLNVTGDANNTYNNFSTDAYTMGNYDSKVAFTDAYRGTVMVTSAAKSYPAYFTLQEKNGNDYLRFSYNPNHAMTTVDSGTPEIAITYKNNGYGVLTATGYKYYVFDMDFGADQWAYKVDGVWETGYTVPEGATDARVALADGMRFYTYDGKAGSLAYIKYNSADNTFYLCKTNSLTSAIKIPLSKEAGVFNHVTGVYDIANSKYYLYIDGVFFSEYNTTTVQAGRFGLTAAPTAADRVTDSYSIAIDNVAMNWYGNDYEFAVENGLDKYDLTKSIYNCADVLYNKDTYAVTPNPERYITVNGNKTYVINAGIDAINAMIGNENSVTTSVDVACKTSADSFTLTLADGAKFNVANASYSFISGANANEFTVKKGATAQAGMSLLGDMVFNLMLDSNGGVVKSVEGKYPVTLDGYTISWAIPVEVADANRITIYYDDAKTVSTTITLDMVKYAEAVNDTYGCGTEESILVYELMQFKCRILNYLNNPSDDMNTYVNAHKILKDEDTEEVTRNCGCSATANISNSDAGLKIPESLKGIIEGISYGIDQDLSKFGIIVDAAAGKHIKAEFTYNYLPNGATESTPVTESYVAEYVTAGGYYIIYVDAAFLHQTLTFTVADDAEFSSNAVEFDYNMQQYYFNYCSREDKTDLGQELILKMYRFSAAAFDYKYLTSDEVTPAE